ncbi:hypothetical protein PC9H_011103 [Pleurotus ostreatus]|uniref:Methyltransferase domain-containing protein n=1 Tax=Pleurotus ostreatus TaxID=5322 RepID=A0A8H7DPA5_PLEOS|nr:uncharacterized protein PC9H_011103 [Pleurotus ostreatus]KAF7422939.1 hypothetical protein PC9H_011103 [Pleurotus ostreatus]KAJ8691083.1 hypothetical protein PTI98_010688 [Pleurotus ostreatus]
MSSSSEPSLTQLAAFLHSPFAKSLLESHPNNLREPHSIWARWWEWSKSHSRWMSIAKYYAAPYWTDSIPQEITDLIDVLKSMEMPRSPISIPGLNDTVRPGRTRLGSGMSPKKTHEVDRMTAYVQSLVDSLHLPGDAKPYFVDVGAGQGYLTRNLCIHFNSHVLALDADRSQTKGAEIREQKIMGKKFRRHPSDDDSNAIEAGTITHQTVHVDAHSLAEVIDSWVSGLPEPKSLSPIPVLLVALHACGSLTPDTLRAFIGAKDGDGTARINGVSTGKTWYFAAAVVVGCCYNLLRAEDFPLSQTLSNSTFTDLPPSAYHLATQIPSHWFDNDRSSTSTALSVRKVVWRALLGHAIADPGLALPAPEVSGQAQSGLGSNGKDTGSTDRLVNGGDNAACVTFNRTGAGTITQRKPAEDGEDESTGSNPVMRRLGRLADSAYRDWDTFLLKVGEKLGISVQSSLAATQNDGGCKSQSLPTATQLETLHVLRCLLGPAVETLIARDRIQWVVDELAKVARDGNGFDDNLTVQCINLFDQGSGSGRNTAIVIAPSSALPSCS